MKNELKFHPDSKVLTGESLNHTAFPLGGIGAGMICFEGTGKLSNFSIWHKPETLNEPYIFAAVHVGGKVGRAKILEGPVPRRKIMSWQNSGNGLGDKNYGLPRFRHCSFRSAFPFADCELETPGIPLLVNIRAWSPFIPGDADNSSLPFAALEYSFKNTGREKNPLVFYFTARNFMDRDSVGSSVNSAPNGFVLSQKKSDEKPWAESSFCISSDAPETKVNTRLFRGGWFDPQTLLWKEISEGSFSESEDYPDSEKPSPGGLLAVPFPLKPGEERTVRMRLAWHVPRSQIRAGEELEACPDTCADECRFHSPFYSSVFKSVHETDTYLGKNYIMLRDESLQFANALCDSSMPYEMLDAISANLAILKTPTVLRQKDGRLWGWEGCCDNAGCCHGSCTHVWNYAQALPHLFPELERSLRESEFAVSQNAEGHQNFRTSLPIRPTEHKFHAAADGQLGGILKLYREWRISGDEAWMKKLWPAAKASLEYCIRTWDPGEKGTLIEPHHNTYDIEFWGAEALCQTFYLGALKAAMLIQKHLGEDDSRYSRLYALGRTFLEKKLFNGEYVFQATQWEGLKAESPEKASSWNVSYSQEALELLKKEGPKYQYGIGCLSDGILGDWMALVCGIGPVIDRKVALKHLLSVFKHNFIKDLSEHSNPQRSGYALGSEAGLLLCTWPKGGKPSLPFPYSDEVWTGIEYQLASHLLFFGKEKEALAIVKAVRKRYDGTARNQFNEYECGYWYARAMSSYALLQAFSGASYDAVEKTLHIKKRRNDFRAFFAHGENYGIVGINNGRPFFCPLKGSIEIQRLLME